MEELKIASLTVHPQHCSWGYLLFWCALEPVEGYPVLPSLPHLEASLGSNYYSRLNTDYYNLFWWHRSLIFLADTGSLSAIPCRQAGLRNTRHLPGCNATAHGMQVLDHSR